MKENYQIQKAVQEPNWFLGATTETSELRKKETQKNLRDCSKF